MRNKGLISVLLGAVIFGLLAATAVSGYLRRVRESTAPNAMVVAKVDIPLGAKVTAEQLTVVEVPKAATPEGTFTSIEQLVGRITITKISAREPLTVSRLAAVGAAGGLSAVIPEGTRAMTVNVDAETDLAGFLAPGTLVDVLAVIHADQYQGAISKIILQNIKVLANGQSLEQPGTVRDVSTAHTVTLQVTPDEAEKLALASAEGKLRLVLRNSIDQGNELTTGATRQTLTGTGTLPTNEAPSTRPEEPVQTRKAIPARPRIPKETFAWNLNQNGVPSAPTQSIPQATPAPHACVEVIEGGKKRTVIFP